MSKVKAHDGDFFNKQADKLTKEALNSSLIKYYLQETGLILVLPLWNNKIIDIPIRNFIKDVNKKIININWSRQNRNLLLFIIEITNEDQYE